MANVQFELVPVDYSKPYDEQTECKRHVVGAYANLARHNMTIAINVIMQAIGMPLFDENDIADAFNKSHRKKLADLDNIQKVNLQKRLYRHFPFFKRMKLEDETKKSVQLNTLLEVMADFTNCMAMIRNFYTHYHPYNSPAELANQQELKTKMGKRLQYLFENTSQLFKTNETLDHESNEVFAALRIPEDYIEEFMPGDKEYQSLYELLNDPKVSRFKKQGLRFDMKTQKITKKTIRYIRNPNYQAYMMDDKNGMSDIAIIYFLCLFLEKKVSFELMEEVGLTQQIKFTGNNAEQQLLFVKEIMCMNRIRMTKTKLDSEMTDTALALDMINELRKCPKPLYEVFCKEARDEFKDDSTVQWEKTHGKEAVETEENSEEENVSSEKDTPRSTFVRWEDRFPQMALRYIDYQGLFNDIRFQLNLGKYRFAFYQHDKNYSVDNEERLRILQKELHGFGRIQEVESKKKEKWFGLFNETYIEEGLTKKKPDEAGQTPYVTEQKAQYAIDEKSHSIGLRWEGWQATGDTQKHYGDLDNQKMFIPYLPSRPLAEEKQTNQSEPLLPPQAILSLYELPGLLFYQYLLARQGKDKFEAEETIKKYYSRLYKFFEDVSSGTLKPVGGKDINESMEKLSKVLSAEPYCLRITDIPNKLKKYLLGIHVDNSKRMEESAMLRLKERREKKQKALDNFIEKKKKIGSKENKFDKMRATIKTGTLGQLLARDITEWLTDETKAKMNLTGQNYVAMQTALTLLGQSFNDKTHEVNNAKLRDIFVKANILPENDDDYDADLHHPFLLNVLDEEPKSVEEFYEQYLDAEIFHIDYITTLFKKHKAKGIGLYIPFLHVNRLRWKNTDEEAMKKLATRYLECPLQFPTGIFTTPIFNLLLEIENPNLHKALEKAQDDATTNKPLANNAAYLMRIYFKHVEHDHSQPFYNTTAIEGEPSPYRHVYRLFKKLYGEGIPHTNQKTTPSYTVEELRNLRKQVPADIKNYANDEIQTWKAKQQQRFEQKLRKKLKRENDKRYKNYETLLNINDEIRKAVQKEIDTMRTTTTAKMQHQLKKVYDNERTIRRFKTQDVLLLIMAREILKAKSQDEDFTKGFNLKYVMTDSLLDKPIDFDWNVNIENKKKNEDGKVEKETIKKTIRQEGMKMKNYGQFYKFASDHQRLESLLLRLPQDIFQRAEIENEFSYYDTNRGEVFRQVYIIESEAYMLNPDLENDANAKDECEWFWYVDKKGKKHSKRNNFLSLLEILAAGKDGILDEKEKRSLQSTRNAFGHNTYDVDLPTVFEGKKEKMKIPEVANGIKDKIEEQTEELKKYLEK